MIFFAFIFYFIEIMTILQKCLRLFIKLKLGTKGNRILVMKPTQIFIKSTPHLPQKNFGTHSILIKANAPKYNSNFRNFKQAQ